MIKARDDGGVEVNHPGFQGIGRLAGLFAVAWALVGCSARGPVTAGEVASLRMQEASALVLDPTLANEVSIRKQRVERVGERQLFVAHTELENHTDLPLFLMARTFFKDAAGATLEISPWKTLEIAPGGSENYRAISARKEARRFLVQISRAQPETIVP